MTCGYRAVRTVAMTVASEYNAGGRMREWRPGGGMAAHRDVGGVGRGELLNCFLPEPVPRFRRGYSHSTPATGQVAQQHRGRLATTGCNSTRAIRFTNLFQPFRPEIGPCHFHRFASEVHLEVMSNLNSLGPLSVTVALRVVFAPQYFPGTVFLFSRTPPRFGSGGPSS